MDKILFVDSSKCLGCHSCELACSVSHTEQKDLLQAIINGSRMPTKIILEMHETSSVPIHCRHCDDAPCITVCPTGAISRPTSGGPVVLNNEKCIGCHSCILVCPFGVIRIDTDGRTLIKCDLCFERLTEGQIPACAEACITGAIRYITVEEFTAMRRTEYVKRFKVALKEGEAASDRSSI